MFVVLFLHGLCMNSRQLGLRLPQPEFIPGHFGGTLPLRKINVETIWDQRPTTAPEAWSWKPFRIMKYPPGNRSHLPCVSRHYLSRWFSFPQVGYVSSQEGRSWNFIFSYYSNPQKFKGWVLADRKVFPHQKAPQNSFNIMNSFCGSYELKFMCPKNISLRLDTNQFGFNWKQHNTYINSKMTSTTQVVNTSSSIKTNTHTHTKTFPKKMVDCNLLIPIPFQLFLPTCQICVFFVNLSNNNPPFFPHKKKHGKTVKPRRVPGSPNQPALGLVS